MAERQRARLIVEVDLDPVDGWGNDPEDWQRMLQHYLRQIAGHYNPSVELAPRPPAEPVCTCAVDPLDRMPLIDGRCPVHARPTINEPLSRPDAAGGDDA